MQGGNTATLSAPRCNYSHITAHELTSAAELPRLADTGMGLWHMVTQSHRLQCGAGGTDLDLRENTLRCAALLQHGETPLCVGCWMVAMQVSAEQILCAHPGSL